MIHIRYNGRSVDLIERDLEVSVQMSDSDIKTRVARHLEIDPRQLNGYVVDRTTTGNIVIRPEAVYG